MRYDNYQPSRVSVYGQIPKEWKVKKLKYIAKVKMGQSPNADFCNREERGIPFLQGNAEFSKLYPVALNYCEYPSKCSEAGDILLSVRAPVGQKNISDKKYAIGRGLCAITPRGMCMDFLWYLLEISVEELKSYSAGSTYDAVTTDDVKNLLCVFPPVKVQQRIARYLKTKLDLVDDIINAKQKQIDLLQEQRQAIITEAVTKGLDRNVPMKDSGIEWIGEIPEGWGIKRIKHLTSFVASGKTPLGGAEVYVDSGIMFIRSQNVYPEGLKLDDVTFIEDYVDENMKNSRVREYDVLLNITGASIGRSSLVPQGFPKANVNQHVCIVRPKSKIILPSFLHKVMCSKVIQHQIDMSQNGTSREGLTFEQIKSMLIPFPPSIEEQKQINSFVDKNIENIDSVRENVYTQIAKLKEYRQSLIYEAVTGKIKVS